MTARHPRGPQTGRLTVRKLIICAAAALMAATAVPAQAETPRDALVMAFTIDDIISLDPAEIFEFTAAEYRSEEHTSELQSLMRISYAVFCLTKQKPKQH